MASDSALIVISPGDSVDTVIRKVRDAGAGSVELLVPDNTLSLQVLNGFAHLRQSLERDRINVLVISSDEKTLNAARLNRIETMSVEGVRVTLPPPSGADEYKTQVLRADDFSTAAPIADQDAEFLSALDQVSEQNRYAGLSDDDAEMFSALDDLSDAIQNVSSAKRHGRSDDDLAAALNDWDERPDRAARGDGEDWESAFAGEGVARRRVRAEDIDLGDDDISRQRGGRRTEALRDRERAKTTAPILTGRGQRRGARDERLLDLEEAEEQEPRRRSMLVIVVPLLILALLALLALWWYRGASVTLTVAPPLASVNTQPFSGEVVPLTTTPTGANATAVQASPVAADSVFTATGQVISETLAPAGTAKGVITIYNELPQTVELPAGTEFVATNNQNQEVRFVLDVPAVIPAAVSSSSVAGTSTTNGKIDVGVTARSPGSASNVGENAIKQLLIPGQQPIVSDSSNFLIRHPPLEGGSDQPQRIVTNEDVARVLGDALTGLYNAGVQDLRSKIDQATQGIEPASIFPDPQTLGKPESYEPPVVNPPVGQPVDPNDPKFTVTVKTHFSGLAAPIAHPITNQVQTVVENAFKQRGTSCKSGEASSFAMTSWRWDTNRLTADGTITCTPSGAIGPEVERRVRDAVRGLSRQDADTALQALKQQGLIGDYVLPADKDRFPSMDPLIRVTIAQPQPQPTPGTP